MDSWDSLSLREIRGALERGDVSAVELCEWAVDRHERFGGAAGAYKLFDAQGARTGARAADRRIRDGSSGPFCGLPVSAKDLYGVQGLPTFAGTARQLPERWSQDAWLVARLREQGAVFVGKTHTVELAFGAVGINPHWGTPRNPWDGDVHRIPGGSSCGAGVSLWEGSALLALGTDTGGSIRVPASMTGAVGHKVSYARWPVTGVVPLSHSLDTVGALTRSVEDAAWFFGSVDPRWGDPAALCQHLDTIGDRFTIGVPACTVWTDCQPDIRGALEETLAKLAGAGWSRTGTDGALIDEAVDLYLTGGIAGAECRDFLERELPEWPQLLHPTVGERLARSPDLTSDVYRRSTETRAGLLAMTPALFDRCDLLVLPTAIRTAATVAELTDMDRYMEVNTAALRPTCAINLLGLCALTVPVGRDGAGIPVGLQLVAPAGEDERVLAAGLAIERLVGTPRDVLGLPPTQVHVER